jgi:peptidoglycan-associated lipoprotein
MKIRSRELVIAVAAIGLLSVGCAKKKVAAAPPPPPAPAAPAAPAPAPAPPERAAATPAPAPAPAPHYPNAVTRARIDELLARIEDAYYDYNKSNLRPDAVKALQADSTELRDILKDYPDYKLTIQGNCDERGSEEYNMALGEKRADSAKAYLVGIGIPADQLHTISFGKDKPVCEDHNEACWQKNRHVHIVADAEQPQH